MGEFNDYKTFNIGVGKESTNLTNNFDINEIPRNKIDHYTVLINNYIY